ncbi:DUF2591 domain-containing protein [Enterobacter bugandensis]|uniref:phage protein NinX family protein n=1 Tax=Enterobacter bugandensis TaxID=881260 RepID=UPI002004A88A|nr:phage protein NinX family protein [Enterobacter bugandensis]MCK6946295.1 DUF2591 domain-containing protein [Enterobacter bugandensis]
MDYSQLSDFEINKRVGIALGKEIMPDDCQDFGLSGFPEVMLRNGDIKDYCNDPADAWPIIVDNEISLNSYSGTWEASYEYDAPIGAFGTDELVTKAVEGKNPLRTAMIAFLMKREHANA